MERLHTEASLAVDAIARRCRTLIEEHGLLNVLKGCLAACQDLGADPAIEHQLGINYTWAANRIWELANKIAEAPDQKLEDVLGEIQTLLKTRGEPTK